MPSTTENLHELADTIENAYLTNLAALDPALRRHFLFRVYLSRKNDFTKHLLLNTSKEFTLSQKEKVEEFNYSFSRGIEKVKKWLSTLNTPYPHLAARYKTWIAYPSLVYFYQVLNECFYLKFFGEEILLDKSRIKALFEKLMSTPEFFKTSATHSFCIVFYLEYLGLLSSITNKPAAKYADEILKEIKLTKKHSLAQVFNYLYGLTHVAICDSYFYLRRPSQEWGYIADEIVKLLNEYYKDISIDLKIETVLCLLLLGRDDVYLKRKVFSELALNFNHNLKIIDNLKQKQVSYGSVEHTNALFILTVRVKNLLKNMAELQLDLHT